MLKIIQLKSPDEKKKYLADFNPRTSSWIVSDVVSKSAILSQLLERFHLVESLSCLRASELWEKLLLALRPQIQVISVALAKAQIHDWLKDSQYSWAQTPGASETLFQYLEELAPVLAHPESSHIIPQWFSENPSAFVRWGLWYQEAVRIWQKFAQRNLITHQWISGLLLNETGFEKFWRRPLVFDLGIDLKTSEMELISLLGRFHEVTLLIPDPSWKTEYPSIHRKFNSWEPSPKDLPFTPWKGEGFEYRHFASTLAEIKDAVATVRGWCEAGVPLNEIGILTPNRRRIWSPLFEFLKHEGLGLNPVETDPFSALSPISQFLSRLKIFTSHISSTDLELDLFHSVEAKKVVRHFAEFQRLLTNIYSSEAFRRHPKIYNQYTIDSSSKLYTRKEFVEIILKFWDPQWDPEPFEKLLGQIFLDVPENFVLTLHSWRLYLVALISSMDLDSQRSFPNGIYVENYYNAENLNLSYIYFLNLTDSEFRWMRKTNLLEEDFLKLGQALGFNLVLTDPSHAEFVAKWILSKEIKKCVLSWGQTNLSGEVTAPALFWLQGCISSGQDPQKIFTPAKTVWDSLQQNQNPNFPERKYNYNSLKQKIVGELRGQFEELTPFREEIKLSVSALANYNKCPYIFYAQNILHLAEFEPLDLDLGYKEVGSLLHFVLERLLKDGKHLAATEEDLSALIDLWASENPLAIMDAELWPEQKHKLYFYLKTFLRTENATRQRFPKTQTVALELEFKAPYLVAGTEVLLSGRIDRVDSDSEGHFVVIDYKRSESGLNAYKSWIDNQIYQPWLYTMALERGWTALGPQNVSSAQFYVLINGDRSKAYYITEEAGSLYEIEGRAQNKLSRQQRDEYLAQMEAVLKTTVEGIQAGKFHPHPVDSAKLCSQCAWRFSCRAPHLM